MSERRAHDERGRADAAGPWAPRGVGVGGDAAAFAGPHDLWLFGYGSLMWRPELPFAERLRARVTGWHRAFCVASTHHRGSERRPGIVLGLDKGGSCEGIAYRIAGADVAATLAYLRKRELIYGVYREAQVQARIAGGPGRDVTALAYVVERRHPSWLGRLTLAEQALMIRGAEGVSGNNLDYLINTVQHLASLGIDEPVLDRLAAAAAGYVRNASARDLARPAARAMAARWSRQPVPVRPLAIGERRRFMHRARIGT